MAFKLKIDTASLLLLTLSSVLSAAPRLALSTHTVGPVNTTAAVNGPTQTVQVSNLGDGSLNLTATVSASWLSVTIGNRGSCVANGGNCYAVGILLNTAPLNPGTYTEFVTLSDPNAIDAPQEIRVTVNTASVPATLTAYVTPAAAVMPKAFFNIFTTGGGVKGAVSTQSGGNWLSFISGSGGLIPAQSPWLIQVSALPGQTPGTYAGTVAISGSSAPSDNKSVAVTMVVTSSPIIELNNTIATRLTAAQGGTPQYSVVALDNIGQGDLAVTAATGSAKFLTASITAPNGLLIAADPAGLSPGVYSGTVAIASNAANNSQVSIPVQLVVAPTGAPAILTGGIVNISTYAQEAVSAGDIAAIFGTQFAPAGTFAPTTVVPLPTTLGGTQVLVNGVPAPLFFVSPGQINFQIPYSLDPAQLNTVQVVAGSTPGNQRSIQINASSPRLLAKTAGYGAIVNSGDGSLTVPSTVTDPVFQTHPAKPGDVIVMYAIGLGATTPVAIEGQPSNDGSPGKPLQAVNNVAVTFGGGFFGHPGTVAAAFAGLTPTASGLYQINVVIPDDVALGAAVPVSLIANGAQSNTVNLAISSTGK